MFRGTAKQAVDPRPVLPEQAPPNRGGLPVLREKAAGL